MRLIDQHRKIGAAVLLVTHDINPVLGKVDRILYLAGGRFTLLAFDIPAGQAAAYYPETNPLVPLDSFGVGSHTPTSKFIAVRLQPVERTLTEADIEAVSARIVAAVTKATGGSLRG